MLKRHTFTYRKHGTKHNPCKCSPRLVHKCVHKACLSSQVNHDSLPRQKTFHAVLDMSWHDCEKQLPCWFFDGVVNTFKHHLPDARLLRLCFGEVTALLTQKTEKHISVGWAQTAAKPVQKPTINEDSSLHVGSHLPQRRSERQVGRLWCYGSWHGPGDKGQRARELNVD